MKGSVFNTLVKTILVYYINDNGWRLLGIKQDLQRPTIEHEIKGKTGLEGDDLTYAVDQAMLYLEQLSQNAVRMGDLVERYCITLGVDKSILLEGNQSRQYADARKVIAWVLVRRHGASQSLTAKVLGYSGNASVIKAMQELTNLYLTDIDFRRSLMSFCESHHLESPFLN